MYRCELIDDGIVVKRFFREGDSAADVLETLEGYEWPDGEWIVELEN